MQDLVALGTGNSRLMKSNISPSTTLSELISMLNNGTFPYDIGPLNAAGISQQGTALNKANLLTDATAALFGLDSTAVPDDVFQAISEQLTLIRSNKALVKLTVIDTNGTLLPGVIVSGATDINGNPVMTDASGKLTGYIEEGTVNITVLNYADIQDNTLTFTAYKGEIYQKTLTVTRRDFLSVTSSKTLKFSGSVTRVDVSLVGGGRGGQAGYTGASRWDDNYAGKGGNGGQVIIQENATFTHNTDYKAVIGAGGVGGTTSGEVGSNGGATSFLGLTARGATSTSYQSGGAGAARDTPAEAGTNGIPGFFTSKTTTASRGAAGGGGGAYLYNSTAGVSQTYDPGKGGSVGGGTGGDRDRHGDLTPGGDASLPGGGGGGGFFEYDDDNGRSFSAGGDGYAGAIGIRMFF